MSRIGKLPVAIPQGVEVQIEGQQITAKSGQSMLRASLPRYTQAQQNDSSVVVSLCDNAPSDARRFWGLARSMVANLVEGVSKGFRKELELQGVGYRAQMQGKALRLNLGYSNDITFAIPDGINVDCKSQTEIVVTGADKQQVGYVAAEIRRLRPAEPYKGKGIRYVGEYVFRKEGKKK